MTARRVVIACFEGVEILDVAGPASVFACASALLKRQGRGSQGVPYRVELAAYAAGPVPTSSGVSLFAERELGRVRGPIDTLLVPGGLASALTAAGPIVPLVARLSGRARRTASVCTGAFLLGAAGLLEGRRAVTHWASCDALQRRFPTCRVEADRIFVRDRSLWTSAGVTAGLDMALALVEADHGPRLALEAARWGVMYLRRPGGQSQFSGPLAAQSAEHHAIAGLLTFIDAHLGEDLSVDALARRAGMSVRNFARVFARETGATPASYVERARLDAARRALELGDASAKEIAARSGFGTVETMHRVFRRVLSTTPLQYRARFAIRRAPRRALSGS